MSRIFTSVSTNVLSCNRFNTSFKTYSTGFVVTSTGGGYNMVFTFGNMAFYAEIIIIVSPYNNSANNAYTVKGLFSGGNIFGNGPSQNIQLMNITSGLPPIGLGQPQTGSISYSPTTITIPCSATDGSGVGYNIFVNFYFTGNTSASKLVSISVPGQTYTSGY